MSKRSNLESIEEFFLTAGRGKVYNFARQYIDKALIEKALERSFGNQAMAAKTLGINRNTLRAKIKELKIKVARFKE